MCTKSLLWDYGWCNRHISFKWLCACFIRRILQWSSSVRGSGKWTSLWRTLSRTGKLPVYKISLQRWLEFCMLLIPCIKLALVYGFCSFLNISGLSFYSDSFPKIPTMSIKKKMKKMKKKTRAIINEYNYAIISFVYSIWFLHGICFAIYCWALCAQMLSICP